MRAMVDDRRAAGSSALTADLDWFFKVLDARVRLHLGHECEYQDIREIEPPELKDCPSYYAKFLNHYSMDFAERLVFVLGLVPHVRPRLLDALLCRNPATDRPFTEFGGRVSQGFNGFIPTGETALFILAGDDLEKRLSHLMLFDSGHYFSRHDIINLENAVADEPKTSGALALSRDVVELVTTGSVSAPAFGVDFPAKRTETELEWDDLVLEPCGMSQVLEIKDWIEYGDELFNDPALKKKIKPGYRSLFYGPSGTGKTLAASLLGKAACRDVYKIDLSMVISKYIGETEKNLEKVFRQAERRDWILFFDEADALFGKRTGIITSHDRFANQEVSYLLQRVDDYPGVVILASNLKANLDDAFTRRFQSIIHFPMPGRSERERIWENAFSERIAPEKSVKLTEIAARYELSGAAIMNVVRYSTLMAVKNGLTAVRPGDILDGIRRELHKEGKTM